MATNEEGQIETSNRGRGYRAEMSRTEAGSPVLKIVANNPRGVYARERQVSAAVYEIAAEIERKLDATDSRSAISTYPQEGRLIVELSKHGQAAPIEKLIEQILAELSIR